MSATRPSSKSLRRNRSRARAGLLWLLRRVSQNVRWLHPVRQAPRRSAGVARRHAPWFAADSFPAECSAAVEIIVFAFNLYGMNDRLVWIDCEMTGLDIERDALIEIACVVTDSELNLLDGGIDLIIKPPAEALDQMSDVVRDMHTTSGLLADLEGGMTLAEASDGILAYVKHHVREARKVPLCGNSIATDRWFIARDMPELDNWLHYRMIDVSSVKELARRWYPRVYFASPDKHGGHRALADIIESVREMRYYRETVFVPQPGPDSATAREIAARYANKQS